MRVDDAHPDKQQYRYREAERMLGVTENPKLFEADLALKKVAKNRGIVAARYSP